MSLVQSGTTCYLDGYGTIPVYNNDDEAFNDNVSGKYLAPIDNMSFDNYNNGSTPGSSRMVARQAPSAMQGNDIQGLTAYYAGAYEAETGMKAPGALFGWIVAILVVVAVIASEAFSVGLDTPIIWAVFGIAVAAMLIDSAYSTDVSSTVDPKTGDTILNTCVGTLFGGKVCKYYNTTTGASADGPNVGDLGTIIEYAIIGAVVIGGIYIAVKFLPKKES